MSKELKLPVTEELDFAYLLELMRPLHDVPEFSWLPELFSIIGHDKLLLLCKYAGGETIQIPTLDLLVHDIESLQCFYDVCIKKTKKVSDVPLEYRETFNKIAKLYNVR